MTELATKVAATMAIIKDPSFSHARWVPSLKAHAFYYNDPDSPSGKIMKGGADDDVWKIVGPYVPTALSAHAGATITG